MHPAQSTSSHLMATCGDMIHEPILLALSSEEVEEVGRGAPWRRRQGLVRRFQATWLLNIAIALTVLLLVLHGLEWLGAGDLYPFWFKEPIGVAADQLKFSLKSTSFILIVLLLGCLCALNRAKEFVRAAAVLVALVACCFVWTMPILKLTDPVDYPRPPWRPWPPIRMTGCPDETITKAASPFDIIRTDCRPICSRYDPTSQASFPSALICHELERSF